MSQPQGLFEPTAEPDPVLLSRVRAGDTEAYAQLFERHRAAALGFAAGLAGAGHADDLVAEAFTKVLDALQRDLGPTVSFRSYLLTSIRSIWTNTIRSDRRYDLVDDYETLPPLDALTTTDDPDQRFDNGAVAEAYARLPERWQAVLWYTAVEGLPHAEVAQHLGINANAVAALSFRAREGLRQAYLAAHLRAAGDAECRSWAELLPAHARGAVDKRKQPGLEAHLEGCAACRLALADLEDVNHRLGVILLPIVLGAGWWELPRLWTALGFVTTPQVPVLTGGVTTLVPAGWIPTRPPGKASAVGAATAAVAVAAAVALPLALTDDDRRPDGAAATTQHGEPPATSPDPRTAPRPVADEQTGTDDVRRSSPSSALDPTEPPAADSSTAPTEDDEPTDDPHDDPTNPPTVPPTEPPTEQPTTDVALGQATVRQVGAAGQAASQVTIPVANLRTGAVVTSVVTGSARLPVRLSPRWRCETDVVKEHLAAADELTATCTYLGDDTPAGELVLAVVTSGSSTLTATVTEAPGVTDPDPADNTTTVTITP